MIGSSQSPPSFNWDAWYGSVGGRSIKIAKLDDMLKFIKEDQYKRFNGEVNPEKSKLNEQEASVLIKQRAFEFGADEVGVALIEASDIYKGREVAEKFAIVLGKRMLWREFSAVPDESSAIECMRIYYDLGEVVIKVATFVRSLGYECQVEHPIGDSDVLHIPLALKAGFGELGRHGSIIHPK